MRNYLDAHRDDIDAHVEYLFLLMITGTKIYFPNYFL